MGAESHGPLTTDKLGDFFSCLVDPFGSTWIILSAEALGVAAIIAYRDFVGSEMPTLQRFSTCKITMYAGDHPPPHFHIEGRSFRAVVAIEGFVVLRGDVRRAADAMNWARSNPALLRAEWARLNREG